MPKKIRFPLEINGVMVRTLDALIENFDIKQINPYFEDGRLETWCRDRQYDEIAEKLAGIDKEAEGVNVKVSEAILSSGGNFAQTQENLDDILNKGMKLVYLCGKSFQIPIGREGITYIGINEPTVVIPSDEAIDWKEKKIVFKNCIFDEAYQKIADINKLESDYRFSGVFAATIKDVDKVRMIYRKFQTELGGFECNKALWEDVNQITKWRLGVLKLTKNGINLPHFIAGSVACRALLHIFCGREPGSELANSMIGEIDNDIVNSAIHGGKKAVMDFFFGKDASGKFAYECICRVVLVYAVDNGMYNQGLHTLSEFVYLLGFGEKEIMEWCSIAKALLSCSEINATYINELPELQELEFSELAEECFWLKKGE